MIVWREFLLAVAAAAAVAGLVAVGWFDRCAPGDAGFYLGGVKMAGCGSVVRP